MRRKSFSLVADLPIEEVIGRLTGLFEAGGASVIREDNCVRSVHTPVPLLNVDPRLYSRRNWVGINPFALVTGVEAAAAPGDKGTQVNVRVDRRRMLLLLAFEVALIFVIAIDAPLLVVLAVSVFVLSLSGLLLRWSYTLLRSEIQQALQRANLGEIIART